MQMKGPATNLVIDVAGEAVGSITLRPGDDIERCSAELGYWVGEEFWGRGVASSAVKRMCSYGFSDLGLVRIFAMPIVWNPASIRVLQKAGFTHEGTLRRACIKDGRLADMELYALVRE